MPRRFALLLAMAAGPFAFMGACSSEAPTRPAPAGNGTAQPPNPVGGGGGDGGTEGGVDAGTDANTTCNTIENTGLLVDRTGVAADLPASLGGVVADGTYDLTLDSVYVGPAGLGGPTGITVKSSLLISAGRIDQVLETGGAGKTPTLSRTGSTYSVSSATFTLSEICPKLGASKALQFTASDTTLVLTDPIAKEAFTFQKR